MTRLSRRFTSKRNANQIGWYCLFLFLVPHCLDPAGHGFEQVTTGKLTYISSLEYYIKRMKREKTVYCLGQN